MADTKERALFRSGNYKGWHALLLRNDKLTVYSEPAGPLSILEAECMEEGCYNKLKWSNCPRCMNCHGTICPEIGHLFEDELKWVTTGHVNSKSGFISITSDYSCHQVIQLIEDANY